jgi:spoIIIJ-associated protein
MEKLEVSAKTVEEAIGLALERLNVSREEVEVEVLSPGRSGILGFGAEEARISVRLREPLPQESKISELAHEVLVKLLELMKVPATIEPLELTNQGTRGGDWPVAFNVRGDDLGILIGRRGQTLSSLQFMVNLIVGRRLKARSSVHIDVEGYRQRRFEVVQRLALHVADRVKSSGQPVTLEPMPASERRIVHLVLQGNHDVITQSIGEGDNRKVCIAPKRQY